MIISLTTNFIAAFHGLYLLTAHSHSFQLFLFSFWDYVEKSLKTRGVNLQLKKDIAENLT